MPNGGAINHARTGHGIPGNADGIRTLEESTTLTIAINQVEYSNSPEGPIIHIFGRDAGGLAHRIDVTGFLPYFYVPKNRSGRRTLRR